jgi:hypothetical protein
MKNLKSGFVIMLALLLTFGFIQVQPLSALDEGGLFTSLQERDNWILETLKDYPTYVVLTVDQLAAMLAPAFLVLSGLTMSGDVMYQPDDTHTEEAVPYKRMWVFIKENLVEGPGKRGQAAFGIVFFKNNADAEKTFFSTPNGKSWGPVGPLAGGSTDSARRASLERIKQGMTTYFATRNDTNPWK